MNAMDGAKPTKVRRGCLATLALVLSPLGLALIWCALIDRESFGAFVLGSLFTVLFAAVAIATFLVKGFRRRDIEYLPEDHPDMASAIAKARATLPEFRRLLASPEPGTAHYGIKARFPVKGGSEHCWVGDLEMRGSGFFGKLTNHPQGLHGMILGSMVDITEDMITDWAYSKDGVYHGHFTTKVLLPRMSKRMRQRVETLYGWTERRSA